MANLSKDLQSFLNKHTVLNTLSLFKKTEFDHTTKFLLQTKNNQYIESVSMIENDRHTVCLSSQVGCNVDCDFCATGKMGFIQNLSSSPVAIEFKEFQKLSLREEFILLQRV